MCHDPRMAPADVETGGTVESYPALSSDGTLLIGSEDGFLYAIGT